ncbi:hypothetical protein [Paeniglutamicibacter terrestris]|uniref:Uncharacterized protein n=1 Tax=Paeniglutamicibacter terrestris TaxID=2723403 RepID=A0ABX1G501_9MICC|nr:hypothetical protein [Paeniglutamicibacter terrestris]NKG21083.1 hypothetical protein [Paeniglutamicibacter terrestris]
MRFKEDDRVRIAGGTGLGTVTNQWSVTKGEPTRFGVQWDHGTFAFVEDHRLRSADLPTLEDQSALVAAPVAIPGMSEADRAALSRAYQTAIMAVPNESQNRTENGTDVTDWQARAVRAEAQVAAVNALVVTAEDAPIEYRNSIQTSSLREALDGTP